MANANCGFLYKYNKFTYTVTMDFILKRKQVIRFTYKKEKKKNIQQEI